MTSSSSHYTHYGWQLSRTFTDSYLENNDQALLFIAIGSAPEYHKRRNSLRKSWLRWLNTSEHGYSFFTELPDCSGDSASDQCRHTLLSLYREQNTHLDIVFLSGPSGRTNYAQRGFEMLQHALNDPRNYSFVLKTDDDSFTCLPVVSHELKTKYRGSDRLVWAKYWFRKGSVQHPQVGKVRPDDNFMILSRRLIRFAVDNWDVLVHDPNLTWSINWALWSHVLRTDILDDRDRLDSQQHYLTRYMHREYNETFARTGAYRRFCRSFINAHHVPLSLMAPLFEQSVSPNDMIMHHMNHVVSPLRKEGYEFNTRRFRSPYFPRCMCTSNPSHLNKSRLLNT
jgi:hypothetical protein